MLIHKLYVAFIVVARVSFEEKPEWWMVYLEFYIDVVYFVDLIRCFTQPYAEGTKIVYDRKAITKKYLKTWFIFDVYSFFPLALIRRLSKWEEGSKDE